MTYPEALAYISSLEPRGWRLGLDRMQEFVRRAGLAKSVGEPEGPSFIHVAGTNGKGSVTAYLQSLMVETGFRTGAFFSPFVYDIRERVQFGRSLISEQDLARLTEALKPIAEGLADTEFGGATEFEFKTALGFEYWREKQCQWVALEVGLGGRLDATNVVHPKATVIVSIGLDHTSILGSTHKEIAAEKAGIIKYGIPVIVGDLPAEALDTVAGVARELKAPLWRFGKDIVLEPDRDRYNLHTPISRHLDLQPGIRGVTQPHNMALAVSAFVAAGAFTGDENAVIKGVEKASAPGRFESRSFEGHDFLLDGAHNAEASQVLAQSLKDEYPGRRLILLTGMVSGHEPSDFYEPLLPMTDGVVLCPIAFHRAIPPKYLAEQIQADSIIADSATDAIRRASELAGEKQLIVVTGSFYLVGDIGRAMNAARFGK